jgi:hypothetical protein
LVLDCLQRRKNPNVGRRSREMTTFADLEVVVARVGFPEDGIRAGQVGTVVHVFTEPSEAYLVEFANEKGETIAMVTAEPQKLAQQPLRKAA